MWKGFVLLFIIVIALGCEIDPVDMRKVEANVEFRLKEREFNKKEECKQRALIAAEAHVDSIIADISRNSVFSEMFFPERPMRDTTETLFDIELETFNIKILLDSMMRIKHSETPDN